MNMIGRASKKHFPCMGGNLKAAHVKVYLRFLADQAYRLCTGTPHSKLRAVCAWGMAHFLHVLDMSPRILPHGKTEEAVHALQAFLDAYQRLAVEATQAGQCLWKVRPKHHYTVHLGKFLRASRQNPRHTSCFMDEDYVGRVARLAKSCHWLSCPKRTLERYILVVACRWKRRQRAKRLVM